MGAISKSASPVGAHTILALPKIAAAGPTTAGRGASQMHEILSNKFLRRSFWLATLFLLLSLGLLKFLVLGGVSPDSPDWERFVSGVLEGLIATILTTTAVGAFLFYLTPRLDPGHSVAFLPSTEFNSYFDEVLTNSKEWYFRGGLGRFLSAEVLPRLNNAASRDGSPVRVEAQILDPRNAALCEMHAQLRNSVSTADGRTDWTGSDVKVSLYTTIVTCAIFESNNALLGVSVFLMNYFSTDRVDICATSGIVTKDDRQVPGITFTHESILYHSYRGDLAVTLKQADVVTHLAKPYAIGELSANDVREILDELHFENAVISDEEYLQIAAQANEQVNPYTNGP